LAGFKLASDIPISYPMYSNQIGMIVASFGIWGVASFGIWGIYQMIWGQT